MDIITNNTTFFANTIYDKLIKNNINESYLEGGQESKKNPPRLVMILIFYGMFSGLIAIPLAILYFINRYIDILDLYIKYAIIYIIFNILYNIYFWSAIYDRHLYQEISIIMWVMTISLFIIVYVSLSKNNIMINPLVCMIIYSIVFIYETRYDTTRPPLYLTEFY